MYMHTILTETGDLYLNVLRASKYTDLIRILGKNLFQFPVILFEKPMFATRCRKDKYLIFHYGHFGIILGAS